MKPQYTQGDTPAALVDGSVWNTSLSRISGWFRSLANEFGQTMQFVNPDDGGTVMAPYEKDGLAVFVRQEASSTPTVTKDLVAGDLRCEIANTQTGRGWAAFVAPIVDQGADGLAIGIEVNQLNYGSGQPALDTATSKVGISFSNGGKNPATAAIVIGGNSDSHYHGVVARSDCFQDKTNGEVFSLRAPQSNNLLFAVHPDGSMVIMGRQVTTAQLTLKDGSVVTALVLK